MPIIFERNFSGATPGPLSGFPPAAGVSWVNPNYPDPFSFALPSVQTLPYPGSFSATGITSTGDYAGYYNLWLYKLVEGNPYGYVYNSKTLPLVGGNNVAVDGSLTITILPSSNYQLIVSSVYSPTAPPNIVGTELDTWSHIGPRLVVQSGSVPGQYVQMSVSYVFVSELGVVTNTTVNIPHGGWAIYEEHVIRIEWRDYDVDYYMDGALVASVTTNRPPGPIPFFDLFADDSTSMLYIQGVEFDSPDIITNAYWQNKHNVTETP